MKILLIATVLLFATANADQLGYGTQGPSLQPPANQYDRRWSSPPRVPVYIGPGPDYWGVPIDPWVLLPEWRQPLPPPQPPSLPPHRQAPMPHVGPPPP